MKKISLFAFSILFSAFLLFGVSSYLQGTELTEEANLFMVSHSEYRSFEQGQIIGKLFNFKGDPIIVNSCDVTIYNPDKTVFLGPITTDDTLEVTDGTHYINFTTPSEEGVYEYKIVCSFPLGATNTSRTVSNSFHLNPALNTITDINSSLGDFTAFLININDTTEETNEIVKQINDTANTLIINDNSQIAYLTDINNTVFNIDNVVQNINFTMLQNFADIQVNLTQIINDLNNIQDNLFSDTDAFNNFTVIGNNFNTVFSELSNIQTNLTDIINFCDGSPTLDSQLCQWVSQTNQLSININDTLNNVIDVKLNAINLTTTNTFEFLTVNITNNLNSIAVDLTQVLAFASDINNTVTRIEQNVTAIINNQEQQVAIMVFS